MVYRPMQKIIYGRTTKDIANCNPGLLMEKEVLIPTHFIFHEQPSSSILTGVKNVILFGETGTGKSSVINLMAGCEVASTSSDLKGCTLESKEYLFTLSNPEVSLRIFDTVGLEEPKMSLNPFLRAVERANELVTSLHSAGGIDLLLFCVRGGRLTDAMQRDYRLFYEFLCDEQVPIALVITNLENEKGAMDDWWKRNRGTFVEYGISPVAHACITALPARVRLPVQKRVQSQDALRDLFNVALCSRPSNSSYVRDIRTWLTGFLEKLHLLLTHKTAFKKRDIVKRLEKRCGIAHDEAQRVADIITKK